MVLHAPFAFSLLYRIWEEGSNPKTAGAAGGKRVVFRHTGGGSAPGRLEQFPPQSFSAVLFTDGEKRQLPSIFFLEEINELVIDSMDDYITQIEIPLQME